MSEVSRAQQEEAPAKKKLEEDTFIKAAPGALIILRKHDCDELGPNAWFAKLKIDRLRADACEYYKVDVLVSCSACKGFSILGSLKGKDGRKGGDLYSQQVYVARDSAAAALVCEDVNGVEELEVLAALQRNCSEVNFDQCHSESVVFADHSDPENRARRIVVAFEDSTTTAF